MRVEGQGFELILCWFSIVGLVYVVWNRPKKAKSKKGSKNMLKSMSYIFFIGFVRFRTKLKTKLNIIAHNYKKCGKTVLVINKINSLGRSEIKKSAVGFEFVNVLNCV